MLGIVFMWLSVYLLRDTFKQVEESIDRSFNWKMIYLVLALLAIPFLLTLYFYLYQATDILGQPAYLLRAIPLAIAGGVLFAVTYRLKEISLFRHTPPTIKAIFALELAIGLFFGSSATGSKYILTNVLVVFAALFLGVSLSNIAVFAKQFDRLSKVHAILFMAGIFTPLFGTLRAFFFSTFSPFDTVNLSPLVDLSPGVLLLIPALATFYAIRKFTKIMDDLDNRLNIRPRVRQKT